MTEELIKCGRHLAKVQFSATINALCDALEEAQNVLAPFAEEAAAYEPDEGDGDDRLWASSGGGVLRIKHLRAARDVIMRKGPAS